jgi:hypothetical protein
MPNRRKNCGLRIADCGLNGASGNPRSCIHYLHSAMILAIALLPLAGCTMPSAAPPATVAPAVYLDPCAEQLHDVCGLFLLYYSAHDKLPQRLDELAEFGTVTVPMVCPTSHKAYVYDRKGLPVGLPDDGGTGVLVLYDPEPTHTGTRFAILVEPPEHGKPLVARVVQLPEASFAKTAASTNHN